MKERTGRQIWLSLWALVLALAMLTGCALAEDSGMAQAYRGLIQNVDYGDETTYVIGHRHPDSDTVSASMAYANLLNELGVKAEAVVAGNINNETKYALDAFGIEAPGVMEDAEGKQFVLVDHSAYSHAIDNMPLARIVGVVDHHGVGSIQNTELINVRSAPIGSTATLVYLNYLECDVPVSRDMARVMLMGILSDTRNLTSNVTEMDRLAYDQLVKIAEIDDVDALYDGMLKAFSNYDGMSDLDIIQLDYKEYTAGGVSYGVGVLKADGEDAMRALSERMQSALAENYDAIGLDMLYVIIANIREGSGEIENYMAAYPASAGALLEQCFGCEADEAGYPFPDGMSRKKTLIPALTAALEDGYEAIVGTVDAEAGDAAEAETARRDDALVLFTSDVHCGVDQNFTYAGLKAAVDAARKAGENVLLVDDGDSVQGEAIGIMTRGMADIELMNAVGYDIAIPGNHEFDYGVDAFLSLAEQASYTYISCNLVYKGETVFQPYVIRELGGRKVAFVGVTTPQTLTSSTPTYFQDENGNYVYGFLQDETGEGVYNAVQNAADAARGAGADNVIVLAHLGNEAECEPWTYADVLSHTTGIDVLLDGHSHDTDQISMKNASGETVLRSACGTNLSCIGWCRISPKGQISTGLYSWDREASAQELLGLDNEISRAVSAATDELNERLSTVVAHTDVGLTISDPQAVDASGKPIRIVRTMETNLGDLCADAYRDQSGADIAIVNGGGIRANIAPGDVTLNDILTVQPFGNALCMIQATGGQILDALEWGSRAVPGETGGFLQVSGLTYEICSYIPSPCVSDENGMFVGVEGERRVKNVLVGGAPIDPEKTYTLAAHNYMLLENGDGYTMFDGAPLLLDCVKLDNQLLIDYIVDTLGGVIGEDYADPYGQGRIIVTETAD